MTGYACAGCGQVWPTNYCPTCHATIDRSLFAARFDTPIRGPVPEEGAGAAGAAAGAAPPSGAQAWPAMPIRRGLGSPGDTVGFEFTGSAGEYFRIWIVNVVLTVLTLGIYAAWAKVNKRRYFWGNTQLAGRAFEYTGNPIAILKGNLIFGAAAIGYFVAARVEPLLVLVPAVAIWLVYPWLFQKAMRFNAHHTRHRNLRFGFHGGLRESYAIHLGLSLLILPTLGLIWPYLEARKKRYQLGNLSYGTARFRFTGEARPLYTIFFASLGLFGISVLVAILVAVVCAMALKGSGEHSELTTLLGAAGGYLGGALAGVYYTTSVTNWALGHTAVADVASFRSSMRVGEVLKLELVNVLAIVGSVGLAIPWAAVRRARYRWSHLEASFSGHVEAVTAALTPEPGVLGDVAADQFDIDISL
ncbi:MAG TPA: YjgN family protein [Planctomycetota bacterium]|nr:YjgN family protein [Planctomycetota bacterium]